MKTILFAITLIALYYSPAAYTAITTTKAVVHSHNAALQAAMQGE